MIRELRAYVEDASSRITEEEAVRTRHHSVLLDGSGRVSVDERFLEGKVLNSRTEYSYSSEGNSQVITKRHYDSQGVYNGMARIILTPPDREVTEFYTPEGKLVEKVDGLFRLLVKDGERERNNGK